MRFTDGEISTILTLAKTNIEIEKWLFRFNNLTPEADGTAIDTLEPDVVAGIHAFESAGILGVGRAAEILGEEVINGEIVHTLHLESGQPCFHDSNWFVVMSGTYALTDLVEVQNSAGASCAYQAQYIATGEFA